VFKRLPALLASGAIMAALTLLQVPGSSALGSAGKVGNTAANVVSASTSSPLDASTITFAHPTMAGINGDGFELGLRADPTTPSTMYAGAPGGHNIETSWVWKTTDSGKTWKWIPNAAPLNGKVQGTTPACLGGGDTEIAVDLHHHLYFNDLSGAPGPTVPLEFSTGRSDDGGVNFICSSTGVPDPATDRQWYAIEGDPTLNDGTQTADNILYLTANHRGKGTEMGPGCPTTGNVLAMWRSPVPSLSPQPTGAASAAGIEFGPQFVISCNEGIMGNDELSPVATKRAEDGTLTLPTAIRHVFVAHDNANLNQISMARCFAVPIGPATPNMSDPSGLRCVDKVVANLAGPGRRTGANFPTSAIDSAGNVYVVWEEKVGTTQTLLMFSFSLDEGQTWSAPISLPTNAPSNVVGGKELGGPLNTDVFAWPVAGDDGRVDVAWYGTNATGTSPDVANGYYSLWLTQSLNAHDPTGPTFSDPVLASEHFIHKGTMNTLIGNQSGDRALGDFLQLRMGPQGEAMISYADSNNAHHADVPHAMFVRQIAGPSLLSSIGTVSISGLTPDDAVADGVGDAKYEASGQSTANIPNLDITGSSISKVAAGATATSACPSTAGTNGCYRIEMDINILSLDAPPSPDTDQDLVWLTQWLVPGTTETLGGKNLFVYAESNQGGAIQCWTGQSGEFSTFFALTYPGTIQITNAASCTATMGTGGNIVITVPLSTLVAVGGPIDNLLHEVRASTQTMVSPANSDSTGLFNEIDGAQTYVFTPPSADLSLAKTDSPDPVNVGANLTYHITATNNGPDPAAGVSLSDTLPSAASLVSTTPGAPTCTGTTTISCALGDLASGASTSVDILVRPTAQGTLANTATVTSLTPDPNTANNTATTTTTVTGCPGFETDPRVQVVGTAGADTLIGTSGDDILCGLGGNDNLRGLGGNDLLLGGDNKDTMFGGAGNDTFDGGAGVDTVSFSDGPVASGVTANLATGTSTNAELGSDTFVAVSPGGCSTVENLTGSGFDDSLTGDGCPNTLYGAGGGDTLTGGGGSDLLQGVAGGDSLSGGDGSDLVEPGTGDDPSADGGAGFDTLAYVDVTTGGVNINLVGGTATGTATGGAGSDHFTAASFEAYYGTNSADTLTGDTGSNLLYGLGGADSISGGGGNDTMGGGAGADTIDGGNGVDSSTYYTAPNGATVNLSTGTASDDGTGSADTLANVENVLGSNSTVPGEGDSITGSAGSNALYGFGGNDSLYGFGGNDYLDGGAGTDTLNGGDGTDRCLNGEGTLTSCESTTSPLTGSSGPSVAVIIRAEARMARLLGIPAGAASGSSGTASVAGRR
jgi:uncharacterized repeat protein (TIGR01451 family)